MLKNQVDLFVEAGFHALKHLAILSTKLAAST